MENSGVAERKLKKKGGNFDIFRVKINVKLIKRLNFFGWVFRDDLRNAGKYCDESRFGFWK